MEIVPANNPEERKKRSVIYKDKIRNLNKNRKEAFKMFIKAIYQEIVANNIQLIDQPNGETNFLLYCACPTKWNSQNKEDYINFFEEALSEFNRHIHWVINESDAVYFAHRDGKKSVLIIDYESEFIDYTLVCNGKEVSDNYWSNKKLGTNVIEKCMLDAFRRDPKSNFQELVKRNEELLKETGNELDVLSQLELEFRIAKEEGFNSYIERAHKPFEYKLVFSFADVTCDSRFDDIEFRHRGFFYGENGVCTDYIKAVEADFEKLKEKTNIALEGKAIDKIILTGEGCIMGWVAKSVEKVFGLPPLNKSIDGRSIVDDPYPGYTVARGIALYAKEQYFDKASKRYCFLSSTQIVK